MLSSKAVKHKMLQTKPKDLQKLKYFLGNATSAGSSTSMPRINIAEYAKPKSPYSGYTIATTKPKPTRSKKYQAKHAATIHAEVDRLMNINILFLSSSLPPLRSSNVDSIITKMAIIKLSAINTTSKEKSGIKDLSISKQHSL